MTTTTKTTLTAAQGRLLAQLRQGWTLNCYQAIYLKRSPAWYVSWGENRESCFASPAQALLTQGYIIKDGEPVKTMGGRLQRFQLAPGDQ